MAIPLKPITIDDLEFDAYIEGEETLSADIPQYPTENGFLIADSIIVKPRELSMTLSLTNHAITWRSRNGSGQYHVGEMLARLEEMFFTKKLVTVDTPEKTFTNMGILSISLPKNVDLGMAREISISLQQVNITSSMTAFIPDSYGRAGATGANAGIADTAIYNGEDEEEQLGTNGSLLWALKNGIGNFFSGDGGGIMDIIDGFAGNIMGSGKPT